MTAGVMERPVKIRAAELLLCVANGNDEGGQWGHQGQRGWSTSPEDSPFGLQNALLAFLFASLVHRCFIRCLSSGALLVYRAMPGSAGREGVLPWGRQLAYLPHVSVSFARGGRGLRMKGRASRASLAQPTQLRLMCLWVRFPYGSTGVVVQVA